MSDLMREFLSAYIAWVDADAPQGATFDRSFGLCSNAYRFCLDYYEQIQNELAEMFERDGLNTDYPFCDEDGYTESSLAETQHENPARLAWVRKQLETV
jgi:hypothetical protein